MKAVERRLFLVFFILLFFSFSNQAYCQDQPSSKTSKILLIHSYHPEYDWVRDITAGAREALKEKPVDLEIFYMDTKRYTSREWMDAMGQQAREKIAQYGPDVVIVADDDAQAFVTRHYLNKRPSFVFCGVNGNPEDYGFPADNVTGILERFFINQSVDLLKKIIPSARKAVVIGEHSRTAIGSFRYIQENLRGLTITAYKLVNDLPLWQKRILEFRHQVDAIIISGYHTVQGKPGEGTLLPEEVMRWTRENAGIPIVGLLDFAIRDGALCGVVESAFEHGFEAGEIALRILAGERPSEIPIRTARKGISMVNMKAARALGIVIPKEVLGSVDVVIDEE